jgi:hypothetical protein
MSKTFNSKLAMDERCEHGYLKPYCDECFPLDQAQKHHGEINKLIEYVAPTAGEFSRLGRREHGPMIQQIINELAVDHQRQFPGCRSCAYPNGAEYAPPTPEPEEVAGDLVAGYNTLSDQPTQPVDVVEPTQQIPATPVDYSFE